MVSVLLFFSAASKVGFKIDLGLAWGLPALWGCFCDTEGDYDFLPPVARFWETLKLFTVVEWNILPIPRDEWMTDKDLQRNKDTQGFYVEEMILCDCYFGHINVWNKGRAG